MSSKHNSRAGSPVIIFSQDVLSMYPYDLAVLCGTGLGRSDLGEPSRFLSELERKGVQTA
jgi:hypothetical protein